MKKESILYSKYLILILCLAIEKIIFSGNFLNQITSGSPVTVGSGPNSIAFSPNCNFVAIANRNSSNVSVFSVNTSTGEFIPVSNSPFSTCSSPVSIQFYSNEFASVACSEGTINTFSVSDTGVFTMVDTLQSSTGLTYLAYSPNGKFAVTTNATSNQVNVYFVGTNGSLTPVAGSPFSTGGTSPQSAVFSSTNTLLAIANSQSNNISVFTIDQNTGLLTPVSGSPFSLSSTATNPTSLAFSNNGSLLAVSDLSGNISVFNVSNNGTLSQVQNSPFPSGGTNTTAIAFSPSGNNIITANSGSNTISAFNINSNGQLTNTTGTPFAISTGASQPQAVAYSPCGNFVASANSGSNNVTIFLACDLQVTITPPSAKVCSGKSITLTANPTGQTGTVTYSWSETSETTQSITVSPTQNTTYTVTVTDGNTQCTATASTTVTIEEAPNVNITTVPNSPICPGTTITLTANATSTSNNFTYFWTPGDFTTQSVTVSQADTYTVTVTDLTTGCTASASSTVELREPLTIDISTMPFGNIICQNGSVKLTANVSGGTGNYSYEWDTNPIQVTQSIIAKAPGTYTVTATDRNTGCISTPHSIQIEQSTNISPNVNIIASPANGMICQNNTITLTANAFGGSGNYSYIWQGPNNFSSMNQTLTFNNANITISGIYTVIAIDNENQCASLPASINISVKDAPEVSISALPSSLTICQNGGVMLTANATEGSGEYNFQWSNGQREQSIFVTMPGQYGVTVEDVNTSCFSTTASVDVSAGSKFAPHVTITSLPADTVTEGTPIILTAQATGGSNTYKSFNWLLPNGNAFIGSTLNIESAKISDSGTYQVMVIDSNDCASEPARITITVLPAPEPTSQIEKAIKSKYCNINL